MWFRLYFIDVDNKIIELGFNKENWFVVILVLVCEQRYNQEIILQTEFFDGNLINF